MSIQSLACFSAFMNCNFTICGCILINWSDLVDAFFEEAIDFDLLEPYTKLRNNSFYFLSGKYYACKWVNLFLFFFFKIYSPLCIIYDKRFSARMMTYFSHSHPFLSLYCGDDDSLMSLIVCKMSLKNRNKQGFRPYCAVAAWWKREIDVLLLLASLL